MCVYIYIYIYIYIYVYTHTLAHTRTHAHTHTHTCTVCRLGWLLAVSPSERGTDGERLCCAVPRWEWPTQESQSGLRAAEPPAGRRKRPPPPPRSRSQTSLRDDTNTHRQRLDATSSVHKLFTHNHISLLRCGEKKAEADRAKSSHFNSFSRKTYH